MEKTPLQQMIELWEGIERFHFEDYSSAESANGDFRKNARLYSKAQMVVAALTHYQIELER